VILSPGIFNCPILTLDGAGAVFNQLVQFI
jgi:hypothetical protein